MDANNIKDEQLKSLLPLINSRIREIFGGKVVRIILFGSFARGDYRIDSDVDIFVLVDDVDLTLYRKKRVKIITEFLENYDIVLSIRIAGTTQFNLYKSSLPLYRNIISDGISLYG